MSDEDTAATSRLLLHPHGVLSVEVRGSCISECGKFVTGSKFGSIHVDACEHLLMWCPLEAAADRTRVTRHNLTTGKLHFDCADQVEDHDLIDLLRDLR